MIIEDLLKRGFEELEEIDEGVLKTRMLLSSVLGESKEYLVIHNNDKVSGKVKRKFFSGIEKLKQGEPIQYVTQKEIKAGKNYLNTMEKNLETLKAALN